MLRNQTTFYKGNKIGESIILDWGRVIIRGRSDYSLTLKCKCGAIYSSTRTKMAVRKHALCQDCTRKAYSKGLRSIYKNLALIKT